MTEFQKRELLAWLEDSRAGSVFFPLLCARQGDLTRKLAAFDTLSPSGESEDVLRGRIREENWIAALHDIVLDEVQKHEAEKLDKSVKDIP